MNTRHPHDDTLSARASARLDRELETLLDAALAAEPAPVGLADRIVAVTTPRLGRQPAEPGVLARLGPAVLGVAATWALAAGAAMFIGVLQQPVGPRPLGGPMASSADVAGFTLDGTRSAEIDTRLTMLALQVELVDSHDLWAPPSETIDDAAIAAELEAFTDSAILF